MPKKFTSREDALAYGRDGTARYSAAHPDRVRAAKKKHYYGNIDASREKSRAATKLWRKANPDRNRVVKHNSRSRNPSEKLSLDIISRLLLAQRRQCACCKDELQNSGTLDHIMPLALGGTNTDDNVQLLCTSCNCSKGAKHPIDFMQSRGYLL